MDGGSPHQQATGPGNLSAWAVRHPALILFLVLVIAIGGTIAFLGLGRAEDPGFTIKVANVTARWPGATAAEMQAQVADRMETRLQQLAWFESVTTYSQPGFTALQVEFRDSMPPRALPELFHQLRKTLRDLKPDLPDGVIGPAVNDEFGDVDSILYAITGAGTDYAALKDVAKSLRQALLGLPDVRKVTLYGNQDERIFVEFSHARLATLGLSAADLFGSLADQNAVAPAGIVETTAQRVPLRVSGAFDGARAVAETPVAAGGRVFRIGDVATVTRGFEDPPRHLVRVGGAPALLLGVVMESGGNILALGEAADALMAEMAAAIPVGIDVTKIADQPRVVDHALGEFFKVFAEALAIVLAVSFLTLGVRTGVVVALSVPVVLALTFIGMAMLGLDLHRITLGALIIALGLLVDDAIIAVEMMVVKMEEGWSRVAAAGYAWTSTAFPMLTGTLVTAIGFLPIGFANSAVGEYAGGIFWVVGLALMASWLVAVVVTPYLGVRLLPSFAGRQQRHGGDPYATRPYRLLAAVVAWCVRRRLVVVIVTVALFAAALVGFGQVSRQFFPLSERPELFVDLRLPEGTAIDVTAAVAREAESLLAGDPDIATATTTIGAGPPRFWLGLNPELPNPAFAQIIIVAKGVAARERVKARLEAALADGALTRARVRVHRFKYGPPVGFPVEFRVMGPDAMAARRIARAVQDVMRADPRLVDPHLDWSERLPVVVLDVDQARARALGLNTADVARTLNTLVSGVAVTTVRDGTEPVAVVARAVPNERVDLAHLGDLTIPTRAGPVPLTQVARLDYEAEEAILRRRNQDITITVRADVVDGVQPPDVTMDLWPRLAGIRAALPPGFHIEKGGAIEESAKGNASIVALFPAMILGMLTVLMVQVQSFARLLLVVLTAPLGIIGAVLALLLADRPFGFVALLGLIALAGMIMRNAVILVDWIEADVRQTGQPLAHAIVHATVRRARPVVLTALAAILAMIPLSTSAFWGPMATTIMGGLFGATFLTLLFVPALYALVFSRRIRRERTATSRARRGGAHGVAAPQPAGGPP
ncbi:efflux RND transporter permease subunit [Roseospira goensis]|uniref:Multidrug efflux pump subunit AcrB n=1 Tax=Roseospira goensis TaxID=391922 RepID=A0A7W6WJW1_9PROT|nr:efflux RND transporter permease subunit [Roseospira goensis]MBB4285706.1 multidrug efflux pump subunit AcrB [Roseospira goensis]